MKKYLLVAILLYSLLATGYSQDRIITLNYDTIDCRIKKIWNNTIFFDVTTKGVKSSGKLPLKSVLNYANSGELTPKKQKVVNTDPFERLHLGLKGGPSYLLASSRNAENYMVTLGLTSDKAQSYYRDLKSGLSGTADIICLINPYYGAGIKYKFFDTSASLEGFFDAQDGIHLIYTTYKEQIYVNYIGATFYYQQFIGGEESFKFYSAFSLGLALYRNEAEYLNGYFLLKGKNFGTGTSLGVEYFIASCFSVGAELSAFYSSIRKIKITDGTNNTTVDLGKGNYENLSRLDLSFGIRLYLWKK
jgi:hypothetical protein